MPGHRYDADCQLNNSTQGQKKKKIAVPWYQTSGGGLLRQRRLVRLQERPDVELLAIAGNVTSRVRDFEYFFFFCHG